MLPFQEMQRHVMILFEWLDNGAMHQETHHDLSAVSLQETRRRMERSHIIESPVVDYCELAHLVRHSAAHDRARIIWSDQQKTMQFTLHAFSFPPCKELCARISRFLQNFSNFNKSGELPRLIPFHQTGDAEPQTISSGSTLAAEIFFFAKV